MAKYREINGLCLLHTIVVFSVPTGNITFRKLNVQGHNIDRGQLQLKAEAT